MSFQEIEIVEDWKPLDIPALAPFHGQNELTQSDLKESENPNDDVNISVGSTFTSKVEGIVFFTD